MAGKGPGIAVITFPGSNDDRDALRAIELMGGRPIPVWHGDRDLGGAEAVIVPGGFSYGDYLRAGALARFAPAMEAVSDHAEAGRPVLGICNGFQILCEAGLLPGALIRNASLRFVCRRVHVRVESRSTPFTSGAEDGEVLEIPVKHGEGQFVASVDELRRLEGEDLVVFRYRGPTGEPSAEANPNGSANDIAGIRNARGNVVGLMPHPEHAVDPATGPTGGRTIFESLLSSLLVRSG